MNNDITKAAKEIAEKYQNARKEGLTEKKAFMTVNSALSKIYEAKGFSELLQVLTNAVEICCPKAKDSETFAKGFLDIIAGGGDIIDEEDIICFEKLYNKFPKSQILAELLADIYGAFVNQTQNEIYAKKLDEFSKSNPTLVNAAMQRVYALVDSHDKKDVDQYTKAIEQVKNIYETYFQRDFAYRYTQGLKHLVYKQEEEDAIKTIEILEDLLDKWHDSGVANNYLDALSKLTWKQDEKGCLATIQKMESFWIDWTYGNNFLAMHLAYTLANYSLCVEGVEKKAVINRIEELASYWQPAEKMAYELAEGSYPYAHKPAKAK